MRKLNKELLRKSVIENIEMDVENSNIGGASVAVLQSGELLLDECRGFSDVEKKTPLKENSIFRIASMTKPITASAVLLAESRGYFSLSDPISRHFPEFSEMLVGRLEEGRVVPDRRPFHKPLLRDLLTHTSGFMCSSALYPPQYDKIPKEAFATIEKMVYWCLNNTCLTFDPCESVGYGPNLPFDMLALLIERKSGMSFSDFLKEAIFDPLNMRDTVYHPTEEQWGRVVMMCERKKDTSLYNVELGRHTFADNPLSYTAAGAGLVATKSDYSVFCEMLRQGGIYQGKRILSEQVLSKLSKVWVPKSLIGNGATTSYGLSVRVILEGYSFLTAGSYGWSGAYGTHFFIDPENEITAIYMKNTYTYDSLGAGKTGREFEKAVTAALG